MGRALFSLAYESSPVIKTEAAPPLAPHTTYDTWSAWNNFDPDSEEFFCDAEYEAFIPEQMPTLQPVSGSESSSSSSEGSDSDRGSPMAVGSDDPATMIADAYSSSDWEQRFLLAGSASNQSPSSQQWGPYIRRDNEPTPVASHYISADRRYMEYMVENLSALRTGGSLENRERPLAADDLDEAPTDRPRVAVLSTPRPTYSTSSGGTDPISIPDSSATPSPTSTRRPANITPINIPIEPSLPSPMSPESPPLHMQYSYSPSSRIMASPSPPPTVSPRLYNWTTIPDPSSPTPRSVRENNGPLTNPSARLSLARIGGITTARVRVQGFSM